MARIATDEERHAELAWRFVVCAVDEERRQCPGASGVLAAVRCAVAQGLRETRATVIRADPAEPAVWHAHGRLTCAEARAAHERAIRVVILPAFAVLEDRARADLTRSPMAPRRSAGRMLC